MSYGPTKLGRIWVKQQGAWGTEVTSFADTDAIDAQGMFMPSGVYEALGQPTQRPVFGASDKKAGSKAGATAQLTFVLTDCGDASAATIEHKLIADALGTMQVQAAIGAITSASTSNTLTVSAANTAWIGQGAIVPTTTGGSRLSFVTDVNTTPTPDEVSIVELNATPDSAQTVKRTVTVGFTTGGLANLPFTMEFATAGANGGFRAWDGRVTACNITANAKAQILVAVTLQFLDWEYVDALSAPAFSFPRTQLGPVLNTYSVDPGTDDAFCFAELAVNITQTLSEALCSSSEQGVSQLVTTDRQVVITERMLTSDIYADLITNGTIEPGQALARMWGLSSTGAGTGYHVACYGPAIQLQSTSKPVDLGGVWGLERVYEVRNVVAASDGTAGASTVKGTAFRIAFG
jgi:hypothetical protein